MNHPARAQNQIKLCMIQTGPVVVLVFVYRFSGENKSLYETYLNACDPDQQETLARIASGEDIFFLLFDKAGNLKRQIGIPNNLAKIAEQARKYCLALRWSMRDFDEAKAEVMARWSAEELFDANADKFELS